MVEVWNVKTHEVLEYPLAGHTGMITSIAFSPNGHEVASTLDDETVCIWDTRARIDLALFKEGEVDYAELDEEAFRIR